MSNEAIMDRIAKLLAKAKGTDNENEAAIFAAKAAELLAEHNLTEAQLAARDSGKDQPIGEHPHPGRTPDLWRQRIAAGCAKVYFCTMLVHTDGRGKKSVRFYGREHNAKVAIAMTDYLIATVKRMAREYSAAKVVQSDFRRGAGDRLFERLMEIYRAAQAPAPLATGTTLPALYNSEAKEIAAWVQSKYRVGKAKTRGHTYKGDGAFAGRDAANRISLNTQVGRETRAGRLLA